jgi:hypothetical protein
MKSATSLILTPGLSLLDFASSSQEARRSENCRIPDDPGAHRGDWPESSTSC